MSLETYRTTRLELLEEHKQAQLSLAMEYAMQVNKVELGDIVRDYEGSILVESISFSSIDRNPEPIYRGPKLDRDGNVKEPRVLRTVSYTNLKSGAE